MNVRDQQILRIAVPSIVSNITVPLLGLIDVAIVGHMGDAAYIGAVAVGAMVFNLVYWLFAFLRMGTSGMTSQALGRRDLGEDTKILVRSVVMALAIAAGLLVMQVPVRWGMFGLIGPTPDVLPFACAYYDIVVWGAPAMLCLYSLTGWFIGMQNTRFPMIVSITQNVVNIAASLCLVYGLGMKIEGVAMGTVVAQYAGLAVAVVLLTRYYGRHLRRNGGDSRRPKGGGSWLAGFSANRDIFLRTLCLVAVNLYFTSAGARSGAVILSVNTVIMQLYLLFSYFMDGFAYAGEALGGRLFGARNAVAFRDTLRRLWLWALGVTTAYTLLYIVAGQWLIRLLTDERQVVEASAEYMVWAWVIPAAGAAAFIWDGIFIGLTATKGMLLSSVVSTLAFFAVYGLLAPCWGNHALWLAQVVCLAMRGVMQTFWYQARINRTI